MGSVTDLWGETRGRPLSGIKCAITGCSKIPSSLCAECNNYYCLDHINTHSNHFTASKLEK